MFSLHVCWAIFATVFFLKSLFAFYLDIIGIPFLIKSSEMEPTDELIRNLHNGLGIQNFVKIILEQALIFAIYKTVEIIVFTLA